MGPLVGDDVGSTLLEGSALPSPVGPDVGPLVGLVETDGELLGLVVGPDVGPLVGADVGALVGPLVGPPVGPEVGAEVGLRLVVGLEAQSNGQLTSVSSPSHVPSPQHESSKSILSVEQLADPWLHFESPQPPGPPKQLAPPLLLQSSEQVSQVSPSSQILLPHSL